MEPPSASLHHRAHTKHVDYRPRCSENKHEEFLDYVGPADDEEVGGQQQHPHLGLRMLQVVRNEGEIKHCRAVIDSRGQFGQQGRRGHTGRHRMASGHNAGDLVDGGTYQQCCDENPGA